MAPAKIQCEIEWIPKRSVYKQREPPWTRQKTPNGERVPDHDEEQPQTPLKPKPDAQDLILGSVRKATLKTLDKVLVQGVAWTAIVKWLSQLVTWCTTIIVARLLAPSDYGLIGMAAIYVNFFTLFSEFGIGTAVVTLQDLTDDQVSQLNTLSVFVGVLGAAISAIAAIPLGKFFRASALPLVVIVLSCGFVVSGIRTVPYALLQKELRFRLLAVIEGSQGVIQALVTLVFAFLGFGYWALVLGILTFSITPTCLVLIWRRQGFALPKFSSIRKAIHYSRHIMIGRLCLQGYHDSDFIIAGRVLGEAPLGAYTIAWTLAQTPLEKLTALVTRVTPSVFARIQTDTEALRRYLLNITGAMGLIIFPVTIGMALVAPELVPVVLGSKWSGVVLPLELLALHAMFRSNVILLTPFLNVIGEERLVMWNSVLVIIVLPVTFYVGSRWGTAGIAAGWVVIYPLTQIPLFSRIFRRIQLPHSLYLGSTWPALSSCSVMALSVEVLKTLVRGAWPLYARLIAEILVGIISYGIMLFLLHRSYVHAILQFFKRSRVGLR